MASRIEGARVYAGSVTFVGTVTLTDETVTNAMVSSSAAIAASKLQHRHVFGYGQATGTDVASATKLLHIARAAATLQRVEVRPETAPTGGDKQFTVDVKKATDGSTSWTTLLTGVITVDNTSVDGTLQAGTLISSPALVDGDALQVVVTASGSTGSQGDGVVVTIELDEAAS